MRPKKAKLTKSQLAIIHQHHGHPKGGLNLYNFKTKQKVQVKNPRYLQHNNSVIAGGFSKDGDRVSGMVKRHE